MRGSLAVLAVLLLIPFGAHAQVKDADLSVRLLPSSSDLQASGKVRVGQFLTWFAVATNKGPVAVENMAVTIDVPTKRFRYWDPNQKQYVVERGNYELLIGGASDDVRLRTPVKIVAAP